MVAAHHAELSRTSGSTPLLCGAMNTLGDLMPRMGIQEIKVFETSRLIGAL